MGLIPNRMHFTNVWLLFSIHSPSCKYTAQYIYTSGQKKCTHNGIYSNSRGWTVYLFMTTNFIHSISLVNVPQNISILLDKRNAKIIALIPTREDGQFINSWPAFFLHSVNLVNVLQNISILLGRQTTLMDIDHS